MSEQPPVSTEPIVAEAGEYYRRMRYFLMILLIGFGFWFAYDGWIAYPRLNQKYDEVSAARDQAMQMKQDQKAAELVEELKDIPKHNDMALLLQKILAFALPGVGIALVAWARHNSRGEIRLADNVLTSPGHPPVTMDQITALDKRQWDRKDIAFVEYEAGQSKGRIRLDAFVYQTDPIVKIFDRIEAMLKEETE